MLLEERRVMGEWKVNHQNFGTLAFPDWGPCIIVFAFTNFCMKLHLRNCSSH